MITNRSVNLIKDQKTFIFFALIMIGISFSSCKNKTTFKDLFFEAKQINPWLDTTQYRFLVLNVYTESIESNTTSFKSLSYAEKIDGVYQNASNPDTLQSISNRDTTLIGSVAFGNIPLPIKTIIKIKNSFEKDNKKTFGGLYFKPILSKRDNIHFTYSVSPYSAEDKKFSFAEAIELDPCPPMVCSTISKK
jgi:hypothetical protein